MAVTPTLCTLEEVLLRLKLPEDDEQVPAVDAIRLAVEERVLDLTGYTFTGGQRVEQMTNVQIGSPRLTKLRPVRPLSATKAVKVEVRSVGAPASTFSEVAGDVLDEDRGRVVVVPATTWSVNSFGPDGPIGNEASWARWRKTIWPVARFTYLVDALGSATNPVPRALALAAVEWAADVHTRTPGGAVKSWSTESVSESYEAVKGAVPQLVTLLLTRYVRDLVSIAF